MHCLILAVAVLCIQSSSFMDEYHALFCVLQDGEAIVDRVLRAIVSVFPEESIIWKRCGGSDGNVMAIIGVEDDLADELVKSEGGKDGGVMLRAWENVPPFLQDDIRGWNSVREFFMGHLLRSSM